MKSINTRVGILSISETIQLIQWSGIDQRTWHVLLERASVAELTFSTSESLVQITDLTIDDNADLQDVGCELLLLVQQQFPSHWLEVPSALAPANFQEVIAARKENAARGETEALLNAFNENMLKAEEAFHHMQTFQWGFNGRMDFYARYPGYFNQDEIREKLAKKLQLLPAYLVHVSRPTSVRALSS